MPENPVGEARVLYVLPANIMKAFERLLVPMPSIWTTMNPSSAKDII